MANMKMSFYLLLITLLAVTSAAPSRRGGRIHFQDSSETEGLDEDQHVGSQQRNRNHRGRSPIHQTPNNLPQFEQGIPGYPIRGPPQAPLVLPNSQPGQNNPSPTTVKYATPIFATQPKVENQTPKNYHYAGNPFLSKLTPLSPGLTTNQLPSSDKPLTTTPNPRLTNLLYGSNLLEEEANRGGGSNAESTTNVSFIDRGLFDTAPHCKPDQILVNNKCRMAV